MRNTKKRSLALVMSLLLAIVLGLAACGTNSSGGSTEGGAAATSADATASTELVGKPWLTSILQGNLPTEQPAAKDDLYTHYAWDYLKEHQEQLETNMTSHAGDLQTTVVGTILDESKTGHDLDQLRLFYNQAADTEAVKAAGMSEVQPYLDRIDAVTSIDELNALLVADDFPFNPFVTMLVSTTDIKSAFGASVLPNMLFSPDSLLIGGTYYQDTETPEQEQAYQNAIMTVAQLTMVDFMDLGMSLEEAQELVTPLIAFEKQYGKYAEYPAKYLKSEFGASAKNERESRMSLDDMCAFCPNFPLKGMLEKVKKANASTYITQPDYLKALNEVWTNENLDSLKLIAKGQILKETRPYRDPSTMNGILEQAGSPVPDAATFAYTACNSLDTLAQVLAKTYEDEALGDEAKARVTELTNDLIDEYRDLINETTWVSDESKANLLEKLDHMTLNIFEPDGGYFDYSALELMPTDQGGTLFGNYLKLKQYRIDCEAQMIGQPARAVYAWFALSPTMTNALYDSSNNSINILPGYMTSLIYARDISDTDLLASLGFTIGHEISHGFDYSGGQFNAYGEPQPVFAEQDVEAFTSRTKKLADYYSAMEVMPGLNEDGQNCIAEAGADLVGMQLAMEQAKKIEDFDYERFLSKYATVWGQVVDAQILPATVADTHPLSNLRMNVCAQMYNMMYDTLGVVEGDGMYLAPSERIVFWGKDA
ncbi:MAG: M13 family metallopeptidase [Coriobacteriales bacterium]|nr:M13 family metallopeptidase [Coriobacteriales bacterium]